MPQSRIRTAPSGPFVPEPAISVPTLAGLAVRARPPYPAGAIAWVESLRRMFVLDRAATDAVVPGQVVPADDGVGMWRAVEPWGPQSYGWSERTDWHIDPSGSVEGDGSAAGPIPSFREFAARLAGALLTSDVSVTLHGESLEYIDLRKLTFAPNRRLTIDANAAATTVEPSITVLTFTAELGNEGCLLTAVGIADWTPYEGMRCRILTGAHAGDYFWIGTADPGGAGLNVARVTHPWGADATEGTLLPGDTFTIETLSTVRGFQAPASQGGYSASTWHSVQGLNIEAADAFERPTNWLERIAPAGCSFGTSQQLCSSALDLRSCKLGYCLLRGGGWNSFQGCLVTSGITGYYAFVSLNICLFEGGRLRLEYRSDGYSKELGVFNSVGSGVTLSGGSHLQAADSPSVFGYGNAAYGVDIPNGQGMLSYDSTKPTITGTSGDSRITGTPFLWAAVPTIVAATGAGIVTP